MSLDFPSIVVGFAFGAFAYAVAELIHVVRKEAQEPYPCPFCGRDIEGVDE